MTRLPPLNALRAFEAAARHQSFALAANDLSVTPGAVSHQVKLLEAWVGQPLFERRPNGIRLTPLGSGFAARMRSLFDQIAAAGERARRRDVALVTLRCQFSLATRWLARRIDGFARANPDIDLRVVAGPYDPEPGFGGADMAIYYSGGPVPGLLQDRLIGGRVVVAASPERAAALPAGRQPSDLLEQPLLHTEPANRGWTEVAWSSWFRAAGVEPPERPRGLSFNLQHLTQEACVAGAGFALLTDIFIADRLERGDLQQVFDLAIASPHAYFLMVPEAYLAREEVRALRTWLLSQAEP